MEFKKFEIIFLSTCQKKKETMMKNHRRVDNKTPFISQTEDWFREETWMGTRKQVASRKAEAAKKNQEAMEEAIEAAWQGILH